MGLEIMASRLLAPSYGDTVYVWGNLIAVIMGALAVGYRRGGKSADLYPSFIRFSNLLLSAGILILLIPITTPLVLEILSSLRVSDSIGSLLASIVLLFAPTVYLGMVSPYAVKLCTDDVVKIGGVTGSLSSINTAGSILGTFFTVFVLVPNFGTREIITGLGVMVLLVSLLGRERGYVVAALVILVVMSLPNTLLLGRIRVMGSMPIYSTSSSYSRISVVDNKLDGVRTMFVGDMPHSAMYLNGSSKPVYRYTDMFNMAFGFKPDISSVLFIGGGGFSGPKQFLDDYPWVTVDVVEIDPKVVDVAYRFFQVPENDPRLNVFVDDGRSSLTDAGKYDLVVLDAYSHTYVPFHLMTAEFHGLIKEHLNPDGVLVSNLIGSLIGDTSDLFWCEVSTIDTVFPEVSLYQTRDTMEWVVQNVLLVASLSETTIPADTFRDNLMDVYSDLEKVDVYIDAEIHLAPPEHSFVLYDNFAPVESLLNPVTLSMYNEESRLRLEELSRPYIIAAMWVLVLGILFNVSSSSKWFNPSQNEGVPGSVN